jgi:phosphatidylglycerol lysyltransferase
MPRPLSVPTLAPAVTERARRLVLAHGWNAAAYQILNPGLALWFAPRDRAAVGFVETPGVGGWGRAWVAAGAPVCPAEYTQEAARLFEGDAARRGTRVTWFGADERLREVLLPSPTHSEMRLGAQPVWSPGRWPEILASKASLRAQVNRARNKGVRVRLLPIDHPAPDALRPILADWLRTRPMPPMHFMVEPDVLGRLADRRVFIAEREGAPVAYLVASPVPARKGWLVEQIIQGKGGLAPSAPNGTATLLLDAAMRAADDSGARYVTLGLSPLSQRAEPAAPDPLWLHALLGWVRLHGRRFYNFDGLEAFKAKFRPDRWDPLTAITTEPAPSLTTLYAIADAFAGPTSPAALVARAVGMAVRDEALMLRERLGR